MISPNSNHHVNFKRQKGRNESYTKRFIASAIEYHFKVALEVIKNQKWV